MSNSGTTTSFQTFTVYRTLGDETWDQVSFKAYGAERFANVLIAANPAYQEIVFFDSGMILIVPQVASPMPVAQQPWNVAVQYA